MKSTTSFLIIFLICKISIAQSSNPMIGSDTDIKEKLTTIKNAFPDLIKEFGKNAVPDGAFTKYQTEFTFGKAQITLQQYNADLSQEMDIDFNRLNYEGTMEDFKLFFDKLVSATGNVLGKSFYNNGLSVNTDLDNQESVFYYKKGKINDSPLQVDLFFEPKHKTVDIVIKSKNKSSTS